MKIDYPVKDIIRRARHGAQSIYPSFADQEKFSIFGASHLGPSKRFLTLDDLFLLPPQYTPLRLQKSIELVYREPYFRDVDTTQTLGGFKTPFPLVQASMGSPEDWNKVSKHSAAVCGKNSLIMGIGENVATSWGYKERKRRTQPSFKERILTYFENETLGIGGVVIQQNEEDAFFELWNKIYSDPDFDQFIQEGRIAFEIKGGQGAKAGIGGERFVDRQTALDLKDHYIIFPDPEEVEVEKYERHSSPDIFTEEILANRIKKLKNDYPRVRVWLKTAGFRDLPSVLLNADNSGIDSIVVDSKEGGTGMAPSVALQDLGLTSLACLGKIRQVKSQLKHSSVILSGRLHTGSHLAKSLCLGVDGIAMGRPFLISAYSYRFMDRIFQHELYRKPVLKRIGKLLYRINSKSEKYIANFITSIKLETQLLISSLGKYYLHELNSDDLGTENQHLSQTFGIQNILESNFGLEEKTIEFMK